MKTSQRLAAAVVSLNQDPNWTVFVTALGDYGEDTVRNMIAGDPAKLQTMQGQAQAITRILDSIRQAPDVLEKYNHQS